MGKTSLKSIPEVQQFLQDHPNAKITVTYWSEEEVSEISDNISIQCDKNIKPRAFYKATISEGDLKIVSWMDAETQIQYFANFPSPPFPSRPTDTFIRFTGAAIWLLNQMASPVFQDMN